MSPDTKSALMAFTVLLLPWFVAAIAFWLAVKGKRRAIRMTIILPLIAITTIVKVVFIHQLIGLQPDQFKFWDVTFGWHGGALAMAFMCMVSSVLVPGALSLMGALESDTSDEETA